MTIEELRARARVEPLGQGRFGVTIRFAGQEHTCVSTNALAYGALELEGREARTVSMRGRTLRLSAKTALLAFYNECKRANGVHHYWAAAMGGPEAERRVMLPVSDEGELLVGRNQKGEQAVGVDQWGNLMLDIVEGEDPIPPDTRRIETNARRVTLGAGCAKVIGLDAPRAVEVRSARGNGLQTIIAPRVETLAAPGNALEGCLDIPNAKRVNCADNYLRRIHAPLAEVLRCHGNRQLEGLAETGGLRIRPAAQKDGGKYCRVGVFCQIVRGQLVMHIGGYRYEGDPAQVFYASKRLAKDGLEMGGEDFDALQRALLISIESAKSAERRRMLGRGEKGPLLLEALP